MQRRQFLQTIPALSAFAQAPAKPNIIFILADDLGIGGVSCYGADAFRTPQIDALAKSGIRFTNAYTAPLCGPSRALIMTGRYGFRTGASNQDATGKMKPANETFIPNVLKPAGYTSAMVGKWGQLPLGPAEFGFDEHFKFSGSGTYWNTQERGKAYLLNGVSKPLADKQYLPDLMHDFAVDFIRRHRTKPFFLYYSMSHVHGDILPTPDTAPGTDDHYKDNINYMDKLVGKLVAALDELKLREKTLVIFFGDNGTAGNYAERSTVHGKPLAGSKGDMEEGGALVPFIASWPRTTPAGVVTAQLTDATDFLPTFAALAGAQLPAKPIDGVSLVPALTGKPGPKRDWIFMQLARMWYVRDARFKLNQKGELRDMSNAPFTEPLAKDTPESAAARKRLQAVLDKLNPAGGIPDTGPASGRHAANERKKTKR